jgi:hypothetical protein
MTMRIMRPPSPARSRGRRRGRDSQQITLFAEVPLILPIQTPGWQELPNEIRASVTSLLTQLLLDHARANGAVSPGETDHDL